MGTVTAIDEYEELPDAVGKMRLIGVANDVQKMQRKIKRLLKVARAVDANEALGIMNFAINRIDFDILVSMPDTGGLSLPCFNELCGNPTEDGLAALIVSLQNDVEQLYKMARVPGVKL